MCELGKQDAIENYPAKHTGAGWTLAATILTSPLLGLIPGQICSSVIPANRNLKYPDKDLMENSDYNRCYKQEALKMKKTKISKHFVVGVGIWTAGLVYNLIRIMPE